MAELFVAISLVLVSATASAGIIEQECRCVPGAEGVFPECWKSADWDGLNRSVGGRLVGRSHLAVPNEVTDNFTLLTDGDYLTSQPGFTYFGGWLGVWDRRAVRSEFAVLAENAGDIQATVRFATRHNLRLVVKATGHSPQGRSVAAGSLLLWTHRMQGIQWHDRLSVCSEGYEHAMTLEAGVQIKRVHEAAFKKGRVEIGGIAPSVGISGFAMGGGFGAFSRFYGTGAASIIKAEVVLANGSLVLATPCNEYADLLRALRGGGPGTFGVIASLTYRTFEQPNSAGTIEGHLSTTNLTEMSLAMQELLNNIRDVVMRKGLLKHIGGFIVLPSSFDSFLHVHMTYVGISQEDCQSLFVNVTKYMKVKCAPNSSWVAVTTATKRELAPLSGGSWFSYWNRLFDEQSFDTEQSTARFSDGLMRILALNPRMLSTEISELKIGFHFGLSQASETVLRQEPSISISPDVFKSIGTVNWKRLGRVADGHDSQELPQAVRAQLQLEDAVTLAWADELFGERAGSIFNSAGHNVSHWQERFWGSMYGFLFATKDKYDPQGLFVCHNCVGSERWTPDGNCRV